MNIGRLRKHSCDMKRTALLFVTAGILLVSAGCHKKAAVSEEFHPQFTATLASGSTGDVMNKFAAQFGVPIYPGATPDTSHFSPGSNGSRTFLTYTTGDSADKVTQFYTSSLGLQPVTSANVTVLQGSTPAGAQVTINIGKDLQSARTTFTVLAVMHAMQAAPPPTTTTTTVAAATPPPAPANTLNTGNDSNAPTWNMDTSNMPQNSNNTSDNSQNQVPPDQSGNSNVDNGQQGQDSDQQGQTSGDNSGNDQQSQDNGPPGGG